MRSCTHSKYEVVTPPALARISGITNTFFSARISSATAVVGPLAPSHRILHLIRSTFLLVITFSVGQGARVSHSVLNSSAPSAGEAPGKPSVVFVFFFYSITTR